MLNKIFGNAAVKVDDEAQPQNSSVQTMKVEAVNSTAANDAQIVQSPTQDHRDDLEQRYQNHNIVKQNTLLRAKFIAAQTPVDEKSMRQVFESVVKGFNLEDDELSFDQFKLLAYDDEKEFKAALVEAIPAEKLEMAKNMHPTKAEMKIMEGLPLEYEHAGDQSDILNEMQNLDKQEAELYHANLAEELQSPTDAYLEIQAELDEIASLESEHEHAMEEVKSQSIGGNFDDKIAFLFDNPQAALDKADKMIHADTKADAMTFVDGKAGQDALKGFENGVDDTFRTTEMKETIQSNFEVLGEANMKGGQDLTGGDNDLRKSIKRDVEKGSVSQETVELQAFEEVGLDEDMLARKQDLEAKRDDLLENYGADIAADITDQRAELGMENMEINSPESLASAVQSMQAELEKRKDMENKQSFEMSL